MNLVTLTDPNAKVSGLVRLEFRATNSQVRAALAKIGTLSRTWDALRSKIEQHITAELQKKPETKGRSVVLLKGNYVKQKGGVVSYHGSNPVLGKYIPGGRKGWDSKTGVFHVWAVIK